MGEHWYDRTGRPCHFQEKADGSGLRATTLRDARKLGLVPSFSTVDSIRNKYQLNKYLTRDAVRLGFEMLHQDKFDDAESYADRVMQLVQETRGERSGSDEGTVIHNAIELLAGGDAQSVRRDCPEYEPHAEAALNEVAALFPDVNDWRSEQTFANPMGFGGCVDLHSRSTGIIVDFKTKDGDLDRKLAYDQFIQLAAYQRGLMLPRNVGANIFVSRTHPGVVSSHAWNLDTMAKGWNMFQYEFGLWVLDKNFDPSWIPGEGEVAA